ncbi:zinc finger (CCCH type) motif-containing protein [Cardiosporidium cionae]|uniref:Zinc finger (CCCH type) motif-containing protein n=1 Tax=Cardiosporidium cionae TaxID=476202 RepID=A0ABQ7JDD5_9APIC|nr:zinc finger (CCCH type) motif-containing protein [Cardiosporidium cionae]|eukprot:KAF8821974.1 zinc finger (CCCH type) motif-containing protein [Cardiosporidium cionae]
MAKMNTIKMQFYKTKMCPYLDRKCKHEDNCFFAHTKEELRPLPNLTKTRLCPAFLESGKCLNGTFCKCAHSMQELRATDWFLKTKVCHLWKKGICSAGENCRYAHVEMLDSTKGFNQQRDPHVEISQLDIANQNSFKLKEEAQRDLTELLQSQSGSLNLLINRLPLNRDSVDSVTAGIPHQLLIDLHASQSEVNNNHNKDLDAFLKLVNRNNMVCRESFNGSERSNYIPSTDNSLQNWRLQQTFMSDDQLANNPRVGVSEECSTSELGENYSGLGQLNMPISFQPRLPFLDEKSYHGINMNVATTDLDCNYEMSQLPGTQFNREVPNDSCGCSSWPAEDNWYSYEAPSHEVCENFRGPQEADAYDGVSTSCGSLGTIPSSWNQYNFCDALRIENVFPLYPLEEETKFYAPCGTNQE